VTRAALAGVSGFALAYLLSAPLAIPILVYDPVARTAAISRTVAAGSMRYFGDLLVASLLGAAGSALAGRFARRAPLALMAGTTLSLVAFAFLYYLSRLLTAA